MRSIDFPEANAHFDQPKAIPPHGPDQIPAYEGSIAGGPLDGMPITITAWKPSAKDLAAMNAGNPLYLTVIGCFIPPLSLSADFESATRAEPSA